jgi:glutamate formiminotransferase / 5-formyltetrahydrofolate cyclo-ligase
MPDDHLLESVPNFSEGRDREVIDAVARAANPAHLLDTDADPDHHRVVVTLAAHRHNLVEGLMSSVRTAVDRIDIRGHQGVHPRVGAADVVPIVPLGSAPLALCREVSRELGERIWAELKVPVYFYGHGENRTLADVRAGRARPDLGGPHLHPMAGGVCVGARHKLVAFNAILPDLDIDAARELARTLRESGGGLRGVQALVFQLSSGRVQLSMNLFRVDETPPAAVIDELKRRGVNVGAQELVGLCPAAVANEACSGKLLEALLAAAAARAGAARCADRGGAEQLAMANRLQREAESLATLGIAQDELLAGAERAAALIPVLAAAHVLDGELRAMLDVAARDLRGAISQATAARYGARIEALDRRLASAQHD